MDSNLIKRTLMAGLAGILIISTSCFCSMNAYGTDSTNTSTTNNSNGNSTLVNEDSTMTRTWNLDKVLSSTSDDISDKSDASTSENIPEEDASTSENIPEEDASINEINELVKLYEKKTNKKITKQAYEQIVKNRLEVKKATSSPSTSNNTANSAYSMPSTTQSLQEIVDTFVATEQQEQTVISTTETNNQSATDFQAVELPDDNNLTQSTTLETDANANVTTNTPASTMSSTNMSAQTEETVTIEPHLSKAIDDDVMSTAVVTNPSAETKILAANNPLRDLFVDNGIIATILSNPILYSGIISLPVFVMLLILAFYVFNRRKNTENGE